MNNILKYILIGAGLLIVIAYIMIGNFISNSSKGIMAEGISQSHGEEIDNINSSITVYDGLYVTGAEVMKFIKKHETDLLLFALKRRPAAVYTGFIITMIIMMSSWYKQVAIQKKMHQKRTT